MHATDRTVNHAGTVQNAHAALDFNGEVNVAGRVNDVDAMLGEITVHALPEAGHRSGGNGNTAFFFLLHPVGRRGAVMNFANPVTLTRVKQNALSSCGFTCVNMRTNADVAITIYGCLACHVSSLCLM